MNKYPLIGVSIISVVLLILGSLTNVVGYQSAQSTTANDSPLFRTRTQRATNQQQNILTSQYLGKGTGNLLKFPIKDNKTESLKRVIEIISKMDDITFAHFTELIIQRSKQDESLRDTNPNEIVQMFRQIRTQPGVIINTLMSESNHRLDPTNFNCQSILFYVPGCYIKIALFVILILISIPVVLLFKLLTVKDYC